jgi:tRNA A37 N6-isopentenylltransferase MiaA
LEQFPAVALLGPRQVGKTTLALQLAKTLPSLDLDLESTALCQRFTCRRPGRHGAGKGHRSG